MSSHLLEDNASTLLELRMDFRDNWLTHFKAVVDKEISDAGGSPVAGRTAVGQKLEKAEQTIYQHYAQKSGKVYPTIEMMVLLEKKYGDGLPPGWAALPPSGVASLLPSAPTLAQALEVVAASLNELPDERRELAAQHLQTLARAPDSKRALESLAQALVGSNASQGIPLESSIAGRIHEATLSVESKDIHPAKTRN